MKQSSSTLLGATAAAALGLGWVWFATPHAPPRSAPLVRARNPLQPHTGILQPVGSRFMETNVLAGGRLRVTLLEADEATHFPITAEALSLEVARLHGEEPPVPLSLRPVPQPGEPAGHASVFEGQVPPELDDVPLLVAVTLPADGKTQRISFPAAWHLAGHSGAGATMPAAVASSEARSLYLTAGGRYTAADIAANGRTTGPEKFAGFQAAHDPNPKPGERICPITKTRANPQVAWVIGGKKYLFCCPPCVDEFLKRAKTRPSSVKPPEAYVQRG